MRRYVAFAVVALAAVALLAGCGGSKKSSTTSSSTNSSASSKSNGSYGGSTSTTSGNSSSSAAMVKTGKVEAGTVIVGPDGRTLYLFEKDKGTASACSGACAQAWPPLTTNGTPKASGTVKASLLGTTKRSDGTMQVTYAGHPLYYFQGDSGAGQSNGQGSKAFGAGWYVVTPAGKKIDES
jgi:predicted lipoprotein with Yx(FWY)xxD motif